VRAKPKGETKMQPKKLILFILFSLIVSIAPTAAYAVQVIVGQGPNSTFGDPDVGISVIIPAGVYIGKADDATDVPFSFEQSCCPQFSAQVVAVPGVPNVLSFTTSEITNIGTSRATLTVVYQHNFVANTSVERFHGASMDGGFFDPLNLVRVVSGNTITKTNYVGYRLVGGPLVFTTYAGPLSYTVPPRPPATVFDNSFGCCGPCCLATGSLICSQVTGGPCDSIEVLYTVAEITLDPGISIGLSG